MTRRRRSRSGRPPERQGSSPNKLTIGPAADTAPGAAAPPGYQGGAVVAGLGDKTPSAGGAIERAAAPAPPIPGTVLVDGQRKSHLKAHSLIDKVYRWENLWTAWRRVRANKGAQVLDRVTIAEFNPDCETHLREIQRKLMERRYVPQPVRRVYIPKASDPKQRRPLGIPVVADRIVGQALLQILDPLFDARMSERSFGFRKGRNAHQAIAVVLSDARAGVRVVVDADISSVFDRLKHPVVMSRVRARVADGRVLDLIEAFLKAGVLEGGVVSVPSEGTPQGGVISPWLANLVVDDLDKAIESRGWRHVRYADDFVVLCSSREEAEAALVFIKEVLGRLGLSLHETKTRLVEFKEGFEFLGFRFRWYRTGVRSRAVEKLKERVRTLTQRQQGRNVEAVIADLNPVIRGWAGYFGVGEIAAVFTHLDGWIRMRIRSFRSKRRSRVDNRRYHNRRLAKWGLLSLLECRPKMRLSYMRTAGVPESGSRSLQRGNRMGSPSALTVHAEAMGP